MDGMKKATVKMCNIIKKMSDHVPESFFWFHILLAANMAIFTLYSGAAVQAILFFSLRDMRQGKFCLKIGTKIYKKPFFFVTEQFK